MSSIARRDSVNRYSVELELPFHLHPNNKIIRGCELTLQGVQQGTTVIAEGGGARILVLGKVQTNVQLIAIGGGARIDIIGDVDGEVIIFARGGGAHVMIHGNVTNRTLVGALGGGARIEIIDSQQSPQAAVQGGGAAIQYLYTSQ